MELLFVLLLVVVIFMMVALRRSLSDSLSQIQNQLYDLSRKMDGIEKPVEKTPAPPVVPFSPPPAANPLPPKPVEKSAKDSWTSGFKRMESEQKPVSAPIPEADLEAIALSSPLAEESKTAISRPPEPPTPGFFERHPDLEKFIGENLIPKIGIGILVIAIAFFVKYAIDQQWIGPAGRVAIGILSGGILVGLAHRLRVNYRAFSSVLIGGGLAVFYFTIGLAHHQFHLFTQTTAFVIMLVITLFSVLLSLLYDKQEVAIIALVGGFATPFIVSNGSGNYISLFIYLLVLNIGLLAIAYRKTWRLLNLLAFIFTVILFGAWLFGLKADTLPRVYLHGLWFGTAFYLLFFAINIAHNIRENKRFIASDFGILLANTSLYFGAGLFCLHYSDNENFHGLFSAILGVLNLVLSYFLFKKKTVDPNILYLLIGITLTFTSITAPLQLSGNHITLFWASETVLLYWLFQKSKIQLIQYSSMIVFVGMLISLLMDWNNIYFEYDHALNVLVNKGFITSLYVTVATFLVYWLRKKDDPETRAMVNLPHPLVFAILGIVLLFVAGALEIYQHVTNPHISALSFQLYFFAYLLGVDVFLQMRKANNSSIVSLCLMTACVIVYLFTSVAMFDAQQNLQLSAQGGWFLLHWMSAALLAVILYRLIRSLQALPSNIKTDYPLFFWMLSAAAVFYLSIELHLAVNALVVTSANEWHAVHIQYIKIGLPILWGVCSLALMYLGMRNKTRVLRIISLSLFGLTLLKLFAYDIRNIAMAGKIAAFFCLGVLLLVVSFMYQRLKRLILDDAKNKSKESH